MIKRWFIVLGSILILLPVISCSTRDSSKKVTEKTLDVIDGISDALKDRGEETGEKAADGLGEVGKGVGKSLSKLLTKNADSIGKVAGEILGKGSAGLIEGLQNTLYSPVEFENGKQNFTKVSYLGVSTIDKNVVIFTDDVIEVDNQVEVVCYNADNKQTQVLQASFPYCSQTCEIILSLKELNLLKEAHRRVVSIRRIQEESVQAAE